VTHEQKTRTALEQIDLYLEEAAQDLRSGGCFRGEQRKEILGRIEHLRDIIFRALGP
jgi:phosphate uptake regulator